MTTAGSIHTVTTLTCIPTLFRKALRRIARDARPSVHSWLLVHGQQFIRPAIHLNELNMSNSFPILTHGRSCVAPIMCILHLILIAPLSYIISLNIPECSRSFFAVVRVPQDLSR